MQVRVLVSFDRSEVAAFDCNFAQNDSDYFGQLDELTDDRWLLHDYRRAILMLLLLDSSVVDHARYHRFERYKRLKIERAKKLTDCTVDQALLHQMKNWVDHQTTLPVLVASSVPDFSWRLRFEVPILDAPGFYSIFLICQCVQLKASSI